MEADQTTSGPTTTMGRKPGKAAGRVSAWEDYLKESAAEQAEAEASLAEAIGEDVERIPVRSFEVGTFLDSYIFDDNDVLLAPKGAEVTEELLEKLRSRGIFGVKASQRKSLKDRPKARPERARVRVTSPDRKPHVEQTPEPAEAPAKAVGTRLDSIVDRTTYPDIVLPDGAATAGPRISLSELRGEIGEGEACYQAAIERHASLAEDLLRGDPLNLKAASEMLGVFQKMIDKDASLGPLLVDLKSDPSDYLYHHGLNVAILSMSIARWLGMGREQTFELGCGALFSDLGMLRVPKSVRMASRKLTDSEWLAVSQHPIHTANILERAGALTQNTLLTAYQTHERCDGTGYPRHRGQMFIHPLARIVGIADTYSAMTCYRPYRKYRISPYEAMLTVLKDKCQLDRLVARAFVNCVSLFPIGSKVRLSDGRVARVLRSNGAAHTRPVVVPLEDDGSESDHEVDLSRNTTVVVAEALAEDDTPVENESAA